MPLLPDNPTPLQKKAYGVMVSLCAALAIGLCAIVLMRGMEEPASAAITFVNAPETSLVRLSAEPPTTNELMISAAPMASTEKGPRTVLMEVTAYCACRKCCGAKARGITASGKHVSYNNGRFVAADPALKFGTRVVVPGYAGGSPVEVIDRGGAIKGNSLDVYFSSHETARKWGRQRLAVQILD